MEGTELIYICVQCLESDVEFRDRFVQYLGLSDIYELFYCAPFRFVFISRCSNRSRLRKALNF